MDFYGFFRKKPVKKKRGWRAKFLSLDSGYCLGYGRTELDSIKWADEEPTEVELFIKNNNLSIYTK